MDESKKDQKDADNIQETPEEVLKAAYAKQGIKGVLALLGITPQAACAELDNILRELPPLPPASQVFTVFDATKKGGGKGDAGPVLELMGLKETDMAPGTSPWAEREVVEKGKPVQKLIISLADGRKISWARP